MPAVVRGGRRQSAPRAAPSRAGSTRSAGQAAGGRAAKAAPRTAGAVQPGRAAAVGRLDLSPNAILIAAGCGLVVLTLVLATGARAERIGDAMTAAADRTVVGLGLGLKRVHVTGASPEATPAIQRALGLYADQPITGVDLAAVRARAESVGWVEEARVVRLLPDTLIVEVRERRRLAVWQSAGGLHLLDGQGRVIPGADARLYADLPLVVGRGADVAAADILPLLAERPRLNGRVDALIRVDERRWNLRLRDGGLIQLPALDVDQALIRLDALDQRDRLLDLGFERVDLRNPSDLVVRAAAPAAPAAPPSPTETPTT